MNVSFTLFLPFSFGSRATFRSAVLDLYRRHFCINLRWHSRLFASAACRQRMTRQRPPGDNASDQNGAQLNSWLRRVALHNFTVPRTETAYDASESGMAPKSTRKYPMTDMTVVQDKMKSIATAHADYMKSSLEANKAYMEKLATVKAPDEALHMTTDHMKSSYETFVAEAKKISDMYKDFFSSAFGPMMVEAPKLHVV
jgi:hypothetical protein